MSLQSNPEPGRTLAQFGIAVAALVIGAAAVFWGIGLVGGGDEVAVSAPTAVPTPSAAPTSEAPSVEPSTAPPSPSPTASPTATDEPTETESASEPTEEPTETESETEEPPETETETETTDVDRSETSLQVLDAIKDGSDRAREVADDLEDDGYRLVAFGPSSIIYDNTTVFWTEGHEDEARELADSNGWDEVVFNDILSETVDVHVVVGLDEAE